MRKTQIALLQRVLLLAHQTSLYFKLVTRGAPIGCSSFKIINLLFFMLLLIISAAMMFNGSMPGFHPVRTSSNLVGRST